MRSPKLVYNIFFTLKFMCYTYKYNYFGLSEITTSIGDLLLVKINSRGRYLTLFLPHFLSKELGIYEVSVAG